MSTTKGTIVDWDLKKETKESSNNLFMKLKKKWEKIKINKVWNTFHEYADISTHFHYETNLFVFADDEDNQFSDSHVQPSDNVSNEKNEKGKKISW